MSTKTKFLKAFKNHDVLSNLIPLLEEKQNTKITSRILENNGFSVSPFFGINLPYKTWKLNDNPNFWFDEYESDREYLDDGEFGLVKKGTYLLRLSSKRVELKTVADLEDALDLANIDKDINI